MAADGAVDAAATVHEHLLPMICVVAASLALGLAPFLYGRQQTGDWSAPNQGEIAYYLQIAAQPYFSDAPYLRDPSVPGGAILYPWLQYVPVVYLARALGVNVFSIAIIWTLFASVATAATLYGLFWYFLRWRWLAAGLTITFLADGSDYHPFIHQIRLLVGGLFHPHRYLNLELFQFRLVNPAVDLPFVFLHILAVAAARNRSDRRRILISGLSFGLLFYVYFYLWTMAAAALGAAFLVDRKKRDVYAKTFAFGFLAGVPAIVHDMLVRHDLSAEGVARFGLFVRPRWPEAVGALGGHDVILIPCLLVALALWFLVSRNQELVYLWFLAAAAFVLSYSSRASGIYLHDYHWGWFAGAILSVLLCLAAASLLIHRVRLSRRFGWLWGIWVVFFFLSGLYVSTLNLRQATDLREQLRDYSQYKEQRLERKLVALNPRAMMGGDDRFCQLAVIGDNVTALAGWPLYISMALKNSDLYARFALNQYMNGTIDRTQFKARVMTDLGGANQPIDLFVSAFDEVSSDPQRFLNRYDVRYAALRTDQPPPTYLKDGWVLVERGPYWQIWQRGLDLRAKGFETPQERATE